MKNRHAIVIHDNSQWSDIYVELLIRESFEVVRFNNDDLAMNYVLRNSPQLAIIHFTENVKRSLDLVLATKKVDPTISVVYVTTNTDVNLHIQAMINGAFTVIRTDVFEFSYFCDLVRRAYTECFFKRKGSRSDLDVFVLMPFDTQFDERYKLGIKEPVEALGLKCDRVDEIQFTGNIINKVYECIESARLIVADMSGKNPNVFYEVGYAHALDKTVILLTEQAKDIPFDLQAQKHIIYGSSILMLREQLIVTVKEIIGSWKSE